MISSKIDDNGFLLSSASILRLVLAYRNYDDDEVQILTASNSRDLSRILSIHFLGPLSLAVDGGSSDDIVSAVNALSLDEILKILSESSEVKMKWDLHEVKFSVGRDEYTECLREQTQIFLNRRPKKKKSLPSFTNVTA